MLSKTSIQAMYINRVKDLKALNAKWDKLIDLRANGEDVDDFLYNVEDDLKRAVLLILHSSQIILCSSLSAGQTSESE